MFCRVCRVVLLLLTASVPRAPAADSGSFAVEDALDKHSLDEVLAGDVARSAVPLDRIDAIRKLVWEKYRKEQLENSSRREELERKEIEFDGAKMRFAIFTIGRRPEAGYPLFIALHGGGGAPARQNDRQWRHMTTYYRSSVKTGVYVAVRGVSDTWNLHFRRESYPLYDRLIENLILFRDVDPNRVYLLGFSAGGDGVYQIAPRMADRWAAASMSAGHHNGTRPTNLYHVPFLLQVGERDRAYRRNVETVQFKMKLEALRKRYPDGYAHDLFVHHGKPHNFRDNDPAESAQTVLADPVAWLEGNSDRTMTRNTNAVSWLIVHRRDPLPERLVWDLRTRAERSGVDAHGSSLGGGVESRGQQFYWLDLAARSRGEAVSDEIVARLDREQNRVVVEKVGSYLRLLLTARTLDLSRPIEIEVESQSFRTTVRPTLGTMVRTLLERGDPHYIFEGECTLEKESAGWRIAAQP